MQYPFGIREGLRNAGSKGLHRAVRRFYGDGSVLKYLIESRVDRICRGRSIDSRAECYIAFVKVEVAFLAVTLPSVLP